MLLFLFGLLSKLIARSAWNDGDYILFDIHDVVRFKFIDRIAGKWS